jgi:uncharacterized protein (TIGR02301 family)
MMVRIALLLAFTLSCALSGLAVAQDAAPEASVPFEPPPPVYEASLLRLAEVLGSLYFLRGLCGSGDADSWKADMASILSAEAPGPVRKSRLVARFNHGFETFNAMHRSCTPASRRAMTLYLDEARRTVSDVRLRYSQ